MPLWGQILIRCLYLFYASQRVSLFFCWKFAMSLLFLAFSCGMNFLMNFSTSWSYEVILLAFRATTHFLLHPSEWKEKALGIIFLSNVRLIEGFADLVEIFNMRVWVFVMVLFDLTCNLDHLENNQFHLQLKTCSLSWRHLGWEKHILEWVYSIRKLSKLDGHSYSSEP